MKNNPSTHTHLLGRIQKYFRLANISNQQNSPPIDELLDMRDENLWTRRSFLKTSGITALLLGSGGSIANAVKTITIKKNKKNMPRIVIVGAGVSGLNAAYSLKKKGYRAQIYEASKRVGGRMFTAKDVMAPGLTTEIGGEFIDSTHKDILRLTKEFGLPLIDTESPSEKKLVRHAWHFNDQLYSEKEVIQGLQSAVKQIKLDQDSLGDEITYAKNGNASLLDKTSLAEYFQKLELPDWTRKLLSTAFVTEYGLENDQQSSLNFLSLVSTEFPKNQFEVFGESDERYKIKGGNQRVTAELAKRLDGQIHVSQQLVSIKHNGQKYILSFEGPNAVSTDVNADIVLLTVPFSILRNINMDVDLPEIKKKAIQELGYGTNAKVMAGTRHRLWRKLGYSGEVFSDEEFQLAWDNSQLQPGLSGGITFYSGGQRGIDVGKGTPDTQVARLIPGFEKVFPGVISDQNGKVSRFHWPSHPYTRGSYSAYKTGQWTTIRGVEIEPVGNLFFAGEHCSLDYQGFMNGGAETGRLAAQAILKNLLD